jgi:hypothetical protein
VSIERSRRALQALRSSWDSSDVDALTSMLDSLGQGLNDRFPDARAFLRIGLDCPAA